MIRDTIDHIGQGYLAAIHEPFTRHPMAEYLRQDAAQSIKDAVAQPYYLVKGSPGQGNWADVPWIGVFDPTVTDSATRGYYVAYLFAADLRQVHLASHKGPRPFAKNSSEIPMMLCDGMRG